MVRVYVRLLLCCLGGMVRVGSWVKHVEYMKVCIKLEILEWVCVHSVILTLLKLISYVRLVVEREICDRGLF